MKIPTDNIFQLIHAMTASEKRYFKRHYSSNKSLTTELFDFINTQGSYDERAVKAHFSDTKLAKNLKVYKVQLIELLLKSLTSYHNKKGVRSKIRIGLEEVEILMNKQLFDLALSRLKKIKKLCLKYEEFSYILPILIMELQFSYFYSANNFNPNDQLTIELDRYSDTIKNIFRLKQINLSITSRHNHQLTQNLTSEEKAFYERFLEKELPNADNQALSFNERYFINSILAYIYNIVYNDADKEYEFKQRNIQLFESHPYFIQNHTRLYFAALFNFLSMGMSLGKTEDLVPGMAKVKKLTESYPSLERNLLFVYFLETKLNFNSRNFEFFSESYQQKVVRHIKKYQQEEDYLTVLIYVYFAISFLVSGKPQRVQYYLRRLHLQARKLDPTYAQFFNILELISHYETSDFLVIQNLLSSYKRKQKRSAGQTAFYHEMVAFFGQLIKAPEAERPALARALMENSENFSEDGVRNLLKVFILESWLGAIREKKTYSEYFGSYTNFS